VSLLAAALATGGGSAGEPVPARQGEEAEVARVVHDSIRWALTKDRELQESTMAHDDDLFIVWIDEGSMVSGWDEYVKLFDTWMDPRFKATVTEVKDLRVHVSRAGNVAWYSAMLDDLGEWDGKPRGARNIRWTGVLEKRAGRWVTVQMHGSVARDRVLLEARAAGAAEP
jgi:ketosteroid isomerase-like protein